MSSGMSQVPPLSLAERDRRWDAARRLMLMQSVRCLLVLPDPYSWTSPDAYFTNDEPSAVVFPLEGDPVGLVGAPGASGGFLQSEERGEASWVTDWRFLPLESGIVQVLKEKGFARARIGTVGATKGPYRAPYGYAPHSFWSGVTARMGQASFVELWDEFVLQWLAKSDEELRLFRYVAAIAELACAAMLEAIRPGASEALVYSAVQNEIHRHGARSVGMILQSGPTSLAWGYPKWHFRSQPPRTLRVGDIVLAEIFPQVGQVQAQAQMCVALGDVNEIYPRAAAVARESYDTGIQVIRSGLRIGQVAEEMKAPLERAGAWHLTSLLHTLNPLDAIGPITEGLANVPEIAARYKPVTDAPGRNTGLVLREGMTLQLEPNACFGRRRVNIGGNVIVSANGCEALNEIPCVVHFLN